MSTNPINLAVRFLLEIIILIALGTWGWQKHNGWERYVLVILMPIAAAAAWGIFRFPNDPGKPPVEVSGIVRLGMEAALFCAAALAIYDMGAIKMSLWFMVAVLIHYIFSYDRILWMLRN